ncbi:hypothetical protein JCM8547_007089 [Rhodosporidiobolus lusitaniae]
MAAQLRNRGLPAAGMVLGPASEPDRYELVEELHGPDHFYLSEEKAPRVWLGRTKDVSRSYTATSAHPSLTQEQPPRYKELQYGGAPLNASSHPGQTHCISVIDSFNLTWGNGDPYPEDADPFSGGDAAVVLELVGPTLADWQKQRPSPFFPLPLARRLVKQILLALDYLHREPEDISGNPLGHAGILLDDLLLRERYTPDDLKEDEPASSPFLKLVGFGSAYEAPIPEDLISLRVADSQSAAPEQLLLQHADGYEAPGRAVDIWSVGVLTSRLLFNRNLSLNGARRVFWQPTWKNQLASWSAHPKVVVALASLDPDSEWPPYFWQVYRRQVVPGFPFDDATVKPVANLQKRIKKEKKVTDPDDARQLASFLQACWTLDPFKRPTTKELLEHEWLRGVE